MTEISGKMYIIIGIAIFLGSLGINILRSDRSFMLFIVVGGIMFLYGLFKVIIQKKKADDLHDKHLRGEHKKRNLNDAMQDFDRKHPPSNSKSNQVQHQNIPYCNSCGSPLLPNSNFCSKCGARLR